MDLETDRGRVRPTASSSGGGVGYDKDDFDPGPVSEPFPHAEQQLPGSGVDKGAKPEAFKGDGSRIHIM